MKKNFFSSRMDRKMIFRCWFFFRLLCVRALVRVQLFEQLVSFAGLANVNIDSENSIKRREKLVVLSLSPIHYIIYKCIYMKSNISRGWRDSLHPMLCEGSMRSSDSERERACQREVGTFSFVRSFVSFIFLKPKMSSERDLRVYPPYKFPSHFLSFLK